MLGKLFGKLLGGPPLHEKLPPPQARVTLASPDDVFHPDRAARLEEFARQHLGYTGDFTNLRSVVDLAACADKLFLLHERVPLTPADFIRRHSATGSHYPAEYLTDGIEHVREFLEARGTPLSSGELLRSFLPNGNSLAKVAYETGELNGLLGPKLWRHDSTDYAHILAKLWPGRAELSVLRELVKEATDEKTDRLEPRLWQGGAARLSESELSAALMHRGNLEKLRDADPYDSISAATLLQAALRYEVAPPIGDRTLSRAQIAYLFGDNENGRPVFEAITASSALSQYLKVVAQEDSGLCKALFTCTRKEHLENPDICQLLGEMLGGASASNAQTIPALKHLTLSPLNEPWLLTAERVGWGETQRASLRKGESLIDPEDLQTPGYDGKSYLQLLGAAPEANFATAVLSCYGKLSGLLKPTLLLTDHLRHNKATRGSAIEQMSLAQAYASGIIGDCVRQGRAREVCGILTNRGYLPDPALLQKKISYADKVGKDEPTTLLQAILAADGNWDFAERMALVGPSALKDSIAASTERELLARPGLLKAVGPNLTSDEALTLLTKDKKPVLSALIRAQALEAEHLASWQQQPAVLFGTLGKSTLFRELQGSYSAEQLLDISLLAAQPQYLLEAVKQSQNLAALAPTLTQAFGQLAQDIALGGRPAATLGFTTQDWLMDQPDGTESLLICAARAGLFSSVRKVLALLPDAPSASVLARTGSGKGALTAILKERNELGQLASVSEWGDDFDGYLAFRQKLEGKKLDAEDARFQFYAARLKARHRAPA